jgi:hypothetical protein
MSTSNHADATPISNSSVWIQVLPGEGSGLANVMKEYRFASKDLGLKYVRTHYHGHPSGPLQSPIAEHLLGWSLEYYCNAAENAGNMGSGRNGLNAAGVYLGCELASGLSRYVNLDGDIFVTGMRKADGKALNEDSLWGILNFIYDAMDLYSDVDDPGRYLRGLSVEYRKQTWQPRGGNGGVDVYSVG